MTSDRAVELCVSAVLLALTVGGPVLLAALAIGLLVGLLQSLTQLHDPTIAFVPKLIMMSLVILMLLPWGIERMMQYATDLIHEIPVHE